LIVIDNGRFDIPDSKRIASKMDVFPMHCSANVGKDNDSAVFFGLSGTGKTTLSADSNRKLIGDDEHGWSDDSIFNFEGGCYAKCINLSVETEPEIYNAIKAGAMVENVVMDEETREFDFFDDSLAVNTRVGYPIEHIPNAVLSGMCKSVPKTVIFLTADAYGVLPPISKLDKNQAMYYFVSGFTSKVAGTEIGITEPVPTFSTCFGEPFLPLDPSVYARMLAEKVEKSGANVYLINTGWNGTGKRMKLSYTRAMVTAALTGEIEKSEFVKDETFGVAVPTSIEGVPSELLIPANTWEDKNAYEKRCQKLASSFVENFKKYTKMDAEGESFEKALATAQDLGYAERNPEADVEGHDTCRKIAILSSLATGKEVNFENIHTEGITKIDTTDFEYAKHLNTSIKLCGDAKFEDDKLFAFVAPVMVENNHPLFMVNDVFNGIMVEGNMLGKTILT